MFRNFFVIILGLICLPAIVECLDRAREEETGEPRNYPRGVVVISFLMKLVTYATVAGLFMWLLLIMDT